MTASLIVTLPESSIARHIHDRWELVPLRIPTGWHVRWNGIEARRLSDGRFEVNDSQDLFWATREHGRVSLGGALRLDAFFGYFVPGTFELGYARGLTSQGINETWFLLTGSL